MMSAHLVKGISIVVPVYRGAKTLRPLVTRIEQVLSPLRLSFEVLLVNDCSPDESESVIRSIEAEKTWVRSIHLMRNYGQHNAILAGIRQARFDRIITMDDDLQHPPEAIPQLVEKLDEGYDVVYGTPVKENHGFFRDFSSIATKTILKCVLGVTVAREVASFRAFRTELREAFSDYNSPSVFLDVLLTWGTTSFSSVPVQHEDRPNGESSYTFWKLAIHAINMVTSFSTLPLRIASLMGVATVIFGTVLLAITLLLWMFGGIPVRGFTLLFTMIVIFSGTQLLSLGILGEYLARMYLRSLGRPPYVIKNSSS